MPVKLLLSNHKININSPNITACGHITEPKNDIKYLGITIDKKFKLSEGRNSLDH